MFKNQLQIKLAFLVIAGLILSPFAEAAFRTSKTGKGKYDGSSVSTITSSCLTNGFPIDTAGATLCQEVTAGTYDTDCVNWGLDQSPVVSISACSGLTHTQYTNFKTAYGQATLGISNGGNGFTSYTEQKSYFGTYLTNTKAIYANQLGYSASASHNTTYEAAASAVTSLQSQCSSSTTSPLTTCSASISNCACIPKSEYDDIASGAVAVAAALDAADNTPHTLTKALIDNIVGLDTSSIDLTDSNVIDYLAGQFASLDSTTTTQPSQLTSYVVGATATNVALWKIGKMVSDGTNHPSTGLSESLIDSAVGNSFSTSDALALDSTKTISTLRTALSGSGLGSSPTASAVQGWVGTHVGFASATSFTAYLANTDKSNYSVTNWAACYTSSDSATGGASSCTISYSSWQAVTALASVADGDSNLTASNVTNILSTTGETANSSLDTTDSKHLDYLQSCASGTSPAQAVADCAASSNFLANASSFEIGKAVADNSGSYTLASVITTSTLGDAGVATNSKNVIGGNYCGSSGTSSCLTALKTALSSSGLTASSTPAQVTAKINDLMLAEMKTVANNTSVPTPTSPPAAGCSSTLNMPLPAMCGHPQWTCTKQAGPSDWTISGLNFVVPANETSGSVITTVRLSLGIYSPAYTKDVSRTYNVAQAISGASNGYKLYTTSDNTPWTAWNACSDLGGDLASKPNIEDQNISLVNHMWFAPTTGQSPSTLGPGANYRPWVSSSEITCRLNGTNGQATRGGSGNNWTHCGSSNAYTKSYYCKNLPSC